MSGAWDVGGGGPIYGMSADQFDQLTGQGNIGRGGEGKIPTAIGGGANRDGDGRTREEILLINQGKVITLVTKVVGEVIHDGGDSASCVRGMEGDGDGEETGTSGIITTDPTKTHGQTIEGKGRTSADKGSWAIGEGEDDVLIRITKVSVCLINGLPEGGFGEGTNREHGGRGTLTIGFRITNDGGIKGGNGVSFLGAKTNEVEKGNGPLG